MDTENLFSALSKYDGSRSAENYLTEAFAYVLRYLLVEERPTGVATLNRLCGAGDDFWLSEQDNITIATQTTTEEGRPDISISARSKLARVEVKKEWWPHPGQLERYARELIAADVAHKRLVLLTRYETLVPPDLDISVHRVRWFQIHDWLADAEMDSPEANFLCKEFAGFLEESGMAIQQITWELAPGVMALHHFLGMLAAAIEAAGLRRARGDRLSTTESYVGWYFDGNEYWCGITYRRPLRVPFELSDGCPVAVKEHLRGAGPVSYSACGRTHSIGLTEDAYLLDLEGEATCFFSLSKHKQLETLTAFVKGCYDRVKEAERAVGETGEAG